MNRIVRAMVIGGVLSSGIAAMEQPVQPVPAIGQIPEIPLKALCQKVTTECASIQSYPRLDLDKQLNHYLLLSPQTEQEKVFKQLAETAAYGLWQVPTASAKHYIEPCINYCFDCIDKHIDRHKQHNIQLTSLSQACTQACRNFADLQYQILDHASYNDRFKLQPFTFLMTCKLLTYLPMLYRIHTIDDLLMKDVHVEAISNYKQEMEADLFFNTIAFSTASPRPVSLKIHELTLEVTPEGDLIALTEDGQLYKWYKEYASCAEYGGMSINTIAVPQATGLSVLIAHGCFVWTNFNTVLLSDLHCYITKSRTECNLLYSHTQPVIALTVSTDKTKVASAGVGGLIKIMNLEKSIDEKLNLDVIELQQPDGHPEVKHLAFSHNNKLLISISSEAIFVWDLETRKIINACETKKRFQQIHISKDDRSLVMLVKRYTSKEKGQGYGDIIVKDITDVSKTDKQYKDADWKVRWPVQRFILSPCNQFVVYASMHEQDVTILHCPTEKQYRLHIKESNERINRNVNPNLVISPDGSNLFVYHGDGCINRWKLFNKPIPEIHFKNMLNFTFLYCLVTCKEIEQYCKP